MRKILFFNILTLGMFCGLSAQNLVTGNTTSKLTKSTDGTIENVVFNQKSSISLDQSLELLQEISKSSTPVRFELTKSKTDRHGMQHDQYIRLVNDIPVAMEVYKIHSVAGIIQSANGSFSTLQMEPTTSGFMSKDQALQSAMDAIHADIYAWQKSPRFEKPIPELVILPASVNFYKKPKYAYKINLLALEPLSRNWVYVDASTGELLFKDPIIKHADGNLSSGNHVAKSKIEQPTIANFLVEGQGASRYSGTVNIQTKELSTGKFIMFDVDRRIHIYNALQEFWGDVEEFEDNDNNWTAEEYDNENKDNAAIDALYGLAKTKDFFKEKFDRDSYDDEGSEVEGHVHFDYQYNNAFWGGEGFMAFGDGNSNGEEGNGKFDAMVAVDVMGHELAHGVCEYTAELIYEREYGALNEALSDVWGASIENYVNLDDPDKDTWLIGEEVDRRANSVALRSMRDPKIKQHPSTYKGEYWRAADPEGCPNPDYELNDYCGVHSNSGVFNYWYYLMSEGGEGVNDNSDAYDVEGMGIDKAAEIVYCAESSYMVYNSDYEDTRDFTLQCAKTIYGEDSPEYQTTLDAWFAVGLGINLSTDDQLLTSQSTIYPNPTNHYLQVQTRQNTKDLRYQIINLNGQKLADGTLVNGKINVSILPPGNYILKLSGKNLNETHKFIKK